MHRYEFTGLVTGSKSSVRGPYGNVTPENFGKPGLLIIATLTLRMCLKPLVSSRHLVAESPARREMEKNGNPPIEFEINQTAVACILRAVTMSIPVLTFFNNKGGVGKTSLIYHLAWMFASLGKRVVVADLDPQANITAAFLDEDRIESIWQNSDSGLTIFQCCRQQASVISLTLCCRRSLQTFSCYQVTLRSPALKKFCQLSGRRVWPIIICIVPCAS